MIQQNPTEYCGKSILQSLRTGLIVLFATTFHKQQKQVHFEQKKVFLSFSLNAGWVCDIPQVWETACWGLRTSLHCLLACRALADFVYHIVHTLQIQWRFALQTSMTYSVQVWTVKGMSADMQQQEVCGCGHHLHSCPNSKLAASSAKMPAQDAAHVVKYWWLVVWEPLCQIYYHHSSVAYGRYPELWWRR